VLPPGPDSRSLQPRSDRACRRARAESITEDILLTLTLLRKGYVTRYLCERLAFGLAPESVDALLVQRQRWARGAIQMLYLADGPLGRGLALMQRLLFLPTHWLSLGLRSSMAIVAPIAYLWTGISPVYDVTVAGVPYYFVPMLLALTGGIFAYAPGRLFPLASQVMDTFLSFTILPTVVGTIIKPRGHVFKVTPKGAGSKASNYASGIFWTSAGLMALTIVGVILNSSPDWRIVEISRMIPVVAFWSAINIIVLFFVCMMSLQPTTHRSEERFELDEQISIVNPSGLISRGRIKDLSLSGVGFVSDPERAAAVRIGEQARVFICEVGFVEGKVARDTGHILGVEFNLPASVERDLLIRKLFTAGLDTTRVRASVWSATGAMLKSIWQFRTEMPGLDADNIDDATATPPVAKLPSRSLIIAPQPQATRLLDLVEERRSLAA
jgi:cellulose synthase (UDP-forming)